jgi:ribosome maturation factor RimP
LSGPSGTTIDDVADVHRAVQPVIESMTEGRDLDLEVSTPGIERTLKSTREFSVFEGRGVRVLIDSTQQWVAGIIRSADDTSVTVEGDRGTETIPYSGIVKAKLDYTQEEGR